MTYDIAIVGATGAVGREMLQTLFERKFPISSVHALASKSSLGKEVSFGDSKTLKIKDVEDFDFEKTSIALFSAGATVAKKYGQRAADKGCVVIDNSSYYRMQKDVPLIVPEVNPDEIFNFKKKKNYCKP